MPIFRVEFFKPVVLPEGRTLGHMLEDIRARPLNERVQNQGAHQKALFALDRTGGVFVGQASLIRMLGLPDKTNVGTGTRAPLDLADMEGLGEDSYFAYDQNLDVIAVQVTRMMRPGSIRDLLMALSAGFVEFHPILRQDAWNQFDRLHLVKKIRLKIARPNPSNVDPAPSLRRMVQDLEELNGVTADLEVSVGRSTRALNRIGVRRVVTAALRLDPLPESLEVTGRREVDGEDVTDAVDFLKSKLEWSTEVQYHGRALNPAQCRAAVREALRENVGYLRTYRQ